MRIAVLVSGGGTNLQALIDAHNRGELAGGEIACVISSKRDAYALERARAAGIEALALPRQEYESAGQFDRALLEALLSREIDLVVLAGFMTIIGNTLLERFEHRIINVHPALIPSFCGPGYYGLRVHRAALDTGVKLTGATVHFVTEVCDGGPIILQKAVPVYSDDTPEMLQKRVMEEAEWTLLPKAVALFCQGRLRVEGRHVKIINEEESE